MALALYSAPNANNKLCSTNPFTITFDGRIGGEQDKRIYIRNDATDRWYDDIAIQAVDTEGSISLVDGSLAGHTWKFMSKDIAPTNEEWGRVEGGNTLSIATPLGDAYFGDIVTFLPVWVRVVVPRGMRVQAILDIVLRITATEHAINV